MGEASVNSTDIMAMPAFKLRAHIAGGDVSCSEVADAAIRRIERINPALNAIIRFDPQFVREQARRADAMRASGHSSRWLGIPVTVKDNLWIEGRPVSNGSALFKDFVAPADAPAVAKLRAAGAVILGSTNCSEFACKGVTANPLHGETRNPWNLELTPGGSSGGAAAATAAGIGCIALATDAGGSTRRPAAHTGLVGMKPSSGMIPHSGGFDEPTYGNSVIGLLARRVTDAVDMMDLLAAPDRADPQAASARTVTFSDPPAGAARPRARIGYSPRLGLGFAVDPDVRASVEAMVARLRDAGHSVEEADPDWPAGTSEEALMPLQLAGLAAIYGIRFRQRAWKADPDIARQIEAGLALSGSRVAEALELRKSMYATLTGYFGRFDYLITPTTPVTAWPRAQLGPPVVEGAPATPRAHAVFTPIFNHCFVPACSVPCGLSSDGLPIGLQIAGPVFSDAGVLALAAEAEEMCTHDFSQPVMPELP